MTPGDELAAALDGRVRFALLEGDCFDWLRDVPDGSVDHVITDAPYSKHVHTRQRRTLKGGGKKRQPIDAPLGFGHLTAAVRLCAAEQFARICRRWILAFSDLESAHLWKRDLERAELHHVRLGIWIKVNGQPQLSGDRPAVPCEGIEIASAAKKMRWNGGGAHALWAHPIATDRNQTGARVHPTQKPLALMLDLIRDFTDPNDLVIDPFAGSATTGVACLRLGRRFIGCEINPVWAAAARERLEAEAQNVDVFALRAKQAPLFPPHLRRVH